MDGNEAGHDGDSDAAGADAVQIAEEHLVVEEELADGRRCPRIDLGPEHVDLGIEAGRLGVLLGIASDRDVERRDGLDAFDEIGRIYIAPRGGYVALADPSRRIA